VKLGESFAVECFIVFVEVKHDKSPRSRYVLTQGSVTGTKQ